MRDELGSTSGKGSPFPRAENARLRNETEDRSFSNGDAQPDGGSAA